MNRVTGIGGAFFKAEDPKKLKDWYANHLGLEFINTSSIFEWNDENSNNAKGHTVFAIFAGSSKYFGPSEKPFMVNFRVKDLDGLLEQLKKEGVKVDEKTEKYDYGKFGWIYDLEGNKIELWEPYDGKFKFEATAGVTT